MVLLWFAITAVVIGSIPAAMMLWNLSLYRKSDPGAAAPALEDGTPARVFVCVPARNEAGNIEACVRSVLDGDHPAARVVVYDDGSTDGTGEIVARMAAEDRRVLACPTSPLPEGWQGKQHACWRMGKAVVEGVLAGSSGGEPAMRDGDLLLFTDADVRFSSDALRRAAAAQRAALGPEREAGLVSAFPRQETGTVVEAACVPMMFYLLLGYLPIARMRQTTEPGTSAGCGQFIVMTRGAWLAVNGHEACKLSMHDGIKLPRAVRAAGIGTDLFDGSDLARVRMYEGLSQTWRGFAKNAFEGLGSVGLLVFITVLHLVGHVLPWVLLPVAVMAGSWAAAALLVVAIGLPVIGRVAVARRGMHGLGGALLHPVGVVLMTAIQWHSLVLEVSGRRAWRGRRLGAGDAAGPAAEAHDSAGIGAGLGAEHR